MADETSVQIISNSGEVEGQAQGAAVPEPHDGRHYADETVVRTDRHILDVTDPLAVQVPEGVGATTAGHASPLAEALKRGTVEQQFGNDETVAPEDTGKKETKSKT